MKTFAPKYYSKFKCIAEKCKHSCCVGWEIDIDDATYNNYMVHRGKLKARLVKHINHGENHYFILDDNERCPFLNSNNLCDIYAEMGEASLCQICADHPRFRNFYSGVTEIGLGMCCEEACRLILSNNDRFELTLIDDDLNLEPASKEDKHFFQIRNAIMDIVQDKVLSIDERFKIVWKLLGISVRAFDLKTLFEELEYMDSDVSRMILNEYNGFNDYLERLAVYFIFRHLADSLVDGRLSERVVLAYISVKAVSAMCKNNDFDEICENARIFSSEIEYSEENVDELLYRIGDLIEVLD